MFSITTLERMILESLSIRPKNIPGVERDTGLPPKIVLNVLHSMVTRGIIHQRQGLYEISKNLPPEWAEALQSRRNKRFEGMEICSSLLQGQNAKLKIKKVQVNSKDSVILKAMIRNLEIFLDGLPSPTSEESVKDWSVIVIGQERYEQVVQQLIQEKISC